MNKYIREFAICKKDWIPSRYSSLAYYGGIHIVKEGYEVRVHDFNCEDVQLSFNGDLVWISRDDFYKHFEEMS